ncbi:MAG: ABC transporter substrate-binding protein, partial [Acetobacterales bacterium]
MTAAISSTAPAIRAALVAVLATALAAFALAAPAGANSGTAGDFMQRFADEAVAVLQDDRLGTEQRGAAFHRLLTDKFDLDLVSRYVLGRHWNRATPAEQAEYRALFETFIVATYARRLDAYSGETLQVGHARDVGRGDVAVETVLHRPD